MAHQAQHGSPPKTSKRLSRSAYLGSREGRDYTLCHWQLYHAPQKVNDLHLLAVIIGLYFSILSTIISSKMHLY